MFLRCIKTPGKLISGVFFGCLFYAAGLSAECPAPSAPLQVRLHSVVDGDTLRLVDGSRVRFSGIDAPEVGRDGAPHEPLALAATAAVRELLADGIVGLVFGPERKDRYDRKLAHVYTSRGESVEAALLRRGLAFHIAVPPNVRLADCLAHQEAIARSSGAGIWSESYWEAVPAKSFAANMAGFRRVRGTVTSVSVGRDIWLELDGPVVLRVSASDQSYFGKKNWQQLKGKTLEVQGWIVDRSGSTAVQQGHKPLLLSVRTPHAWQMLD